MIRTVTSILCLLVIILLVSTILYFFAFRQPSDNADHEIIKENEEGTTYPNKKSIRSKEQEGYTSEEKTSDEKPNNDQHSNVGLNEGVDEQKVEKFKNKVKSATPLLRNLWDSMGCETYVKQADDQYSMDRFHREFPSYINDYSTIIELTEFTCSLLHFYENNNETEKYKVFVEKIINLIYSTVFQNFNPQNFTEESYSYALCYARIFILYACYTGENEASNLFKEKCHPVIVKLLPQLNHIVDKRYNDINVLWINTTRLLTNYLCDKEQYDNDIASPEMTAFRNFVNSEKLKNHDSDPTYLDVEYNFYLKLYEALESLE